MFILIFLQTDTIELKPVFGSFICKIESVFIEDKKGQFQMQKETYKALRNTYSYPTIWSYPIYLEVLTFQSLHG